MQTATTYEDYVKQIKERYERILFAKEGVNSVGIGETGRGLGIIVGVENEKAIVPFSLEGIPVKREVVGVIKAQIKSAGVKPTSVWMLGDKTYEAAKKHILSNPNFADVTFRADSVLRNDNVIGYLRHDGRVYYFDPVGGDLPYPGGTPTPQRPILSGAKWKITHYSFGKITVNGEQYTHDVIVGWDKTQPVKKWVRKEWHKCFNEDLKEAMKLNPEEIIIGTGASGMLIPQKEIYNYLKKEGVSLTAVNSNEAWKMFNRLIEEGKHTVLAIHITC